MDHQLALNGIRRVVDAGSLKAARRDRRPTIIQAIEGAQFLEGQIERLSYAKARGVRHLQLFHERDDKVAPLGDINSLPVRFGGLTKLGRDIIGNAEALRLVIDFAHATPEVIRQALAVARNPLIVSHTALRPPSTNGIPPDMLPRLISPESARAIADKGGVIGLWTHMTSSAEEYVLAIKALVDVVGSDHVAIGTDTDLTSGKGLPAMNRAWPDQSEGFLFVVVDRMLRAGFDSQSIQAICGGNYVRLLYDVIGR